MNELFTSLYKAVDNWTGPQNLEEKHIKLLSELMLVIQLPFAVGAATFNTDELEQEFDNMLVAIFQAVFNIGFQHGCEAQIRKVDVRTD